MIDRLAVRQGRGGRLYSAACSIGRVRRIVQCVVRRVAALAVPHDPAAVCACGYKLRRRCAGSRGDLRYRGFQAALCRHAYVYIPGSAAAAFAVVVERRYIAAARFTKAADGRAGIVIPAASGEAFYQREFRPLVGLVPALALEVILPRLFLVADQIHAPALGRLRIAVVRPTVVLRVAVGMVHRDDVLLLVDQYELVERVTYIPKIHVPDLIVYVRKLHIALADLNHQIRLVVRHRVHRAVHRVDYPGHLAGTVNVQIPVFLRAPQGTAVKGLQCVRTLDARAPLLLPVLRIFHYAYDFRRAALALVLLAEYQIVRVLARKKSAPDGKLRLYAPALRQIVRRVVVLYNHAAVYVLYPSDAGPVLVQIRFYRIAVGCIVLLVDVAGCLGSLRCCCRCG